MTEIHSHTPTWSLERGTVEHVARAVNAVVTGVAHVVTDTNVAPLYGGALAKALTALGRDTTLHVLEAGEAAKELGTVASLWTSLLDAQIERTDTVVALGGGVVGDLAGFAAATVLRGVRVVQVPTTVLAMVDASIGGKTGFNVSAGKNLVGAFHPPVATIAWLETLTTLSPRERRSGLAEVVKSALLSGEEALTTLEHDAQALRDGEREALARAASMAAGVKARIVATDLRETGQRAWLNLGHTFGHAIEHAQGYGEWTHGEAVAAGLEMALALSEDEVGLERDVRPRVVALLEELGLPVAPPELSVGAWLTPMRRDKKRVAGAQRFVLLERVGGPVTRTLEYDRIQTWLRVTAYAAASPSHSERRLS